MTLTHPASGQTIEVEPERVPVYTSQGWTPVDEPSDDADADDSEPEPTKEQA